jgi:hypothetical protein
MVLLAHHNACRSLSRHYHYKIWFFYTILSRTTRLDPYTAVMVTVPYRRGDSNRWVRLIYGTAKGRILTIRCTAVTVYGTVDIPNNLYLASFSFLEANWMSLTIPHVEYHQNNFIWLLIFYGTHLNLRVKRSWEMWHCCHPPIQLLCHNVTLMKMSHY